MRILHLTLKKKWFDMIASGEKREVYLELKHYWIVRLCKDYDVARFRNGHGKDSPQMDVEINHICVGGGFQEWGAKEGVLYYVIELGKIL